MGNDPWTLDSKGTIKLPHLSLAGRSHISQAQTRPSRLIFRKHFLMPKQALEGGEDMETQIKWKPWCYHYLNMIDVIGIIH